MGPVFRRSDLQVGQSPSDRIGLQALNLKLQGLKAIFMRILVSDLKVGPPNSFFHSDISKSNN